AVVVPPVELRRQREVRVAAQQDVGETGSAAELDRGIEPRRHAFMGRAIAAAIHDEQRLPRVGEGHQQRVVAPFSLVRDVHALFAIAGGRTIVPSASITAVCARNSLPCCRHSLTRTSLIAAIKASTWATSNRRQKSPAVVGSGIDSAPTASRHAWSFRLTSMSSSVLPPQSALSARFIT